MHVCDVALELEIDQVVFPSNPGLLSAFGLLVADIQHEYVQSLVKSIDSVDSEQINQRIDELLAEGRDDLDKEEVDPSDRHFSISFDMMYEGQAHYLNVPIDGNDVSEETFTQLENDFERKHHRRYGFTDERNPIELVNVRVTAVGSIDDPELDSPAGERTLTAATSGTRDVFVEPTRCVAATCYDWELLSPDQRIPGPAIIESSNSTIWLPPEFDAKTDEYVNVVARRVQE